ncbi:MAG: hypothetical protein KDA84_26455, partial [Planctomycetaceae bacterium]|nr:hypothetical protein [Planctomycetaceae bacterium]
MGLWGVFIAPIVAAILHALIVIFNTEVTELSAEHFGRKPTQKTDNKPTKKPAEGESPKSDDTKQSEKKQSKDHPSKGDSSSKKETKD